MISCYFLLALFIITTGRVTKSIGVLGDILAETTAICVANNIDTADFEPQVGTPDTLCCRSV